MIWKKNGAAGERDGNQFGYDAIRVVNRDGGCVIITLLFVREMCFRRLYYSYVGFPRLLMSRRLPFTENGFSRSYSNVSRRRDCDASKIGGGAWRRRRRRRLKHRTKGRTEVPPVDVIAVVVAVVYAYNNNNNNNNTDRVIRRIKIRFGYEDDDGSRRGSDVIMDTSSSSSSSVSPVAS